MRQRLWLHEQFIYTVCLNRTFHLQGQVLEKRWQMIIRNDYRSALTPKPGPLGGSVRDVKPPAGSHEKRPFLPRKNTFIISVQLLFLSPYFTGQLERLLVRLGIHCKALNIFVIPTRTVQVNPFRNLQKPELMINMLMI